MSQHTFLVAITVNGPDREKAQTDMMEVLPDTSTDLIDCWWIAEDDRLDGSDNDSAVWVTPGGQHQGWMLMKISGLSSEHNRPANSPGRFLSPKIR